MVDVYNINEADLREPRPGGAKTALPAEVAASRFVASLKGGDVVEVTWDDDTTALYDIERSRVADNDSPLRVRGRRTDTTQHLEVFSLMLAKMARSYGHAPEGSALRKLEDKLSPKPTFHKQEVAPEVQPPAKPGVIRAKVLEDASEAVLRDRTVTHGGNLEQSFAAIAAHWTILFGVDVEPWQVPLAMNLLKIVRANHNPKHLDNWTDQAGYAACGAELADEPL